MKNVSLKKGVEAGDIDKVSIQQRIEQLEKDVAELKVRRERGGNGPGRDAREMMLSTFGKMPDDEISREAERLGREWRERQPKC